MFKKPLYMSLLILPLWLTGCANEKTLVGHWRAIDEPDCRTQCAFHLIAQTTGYRAVFNGDNAKAYNGPVSYVGKGQYIIKAPVGEIPLELKQGKLYHPWGRVFVRDEPVEVENNRPRCFFAWW